MGGATAIIAAGFLAAVSAGAVAAGPQGAFASRANPLAADVVCRLEGRVLIFAGASDTPLLVCLSRHQRSRARTLVVTSPGGEVVASISAAYMIRAMNLDVEVDRYCHSSCSNYVLPAARRVTIRKGALVTIHGAPGNADESDRESVIRAMMSQLNMSREEAVATAGPSIANMVASSEMHRIFQVNMRVRRAFYDPPSADATNPSAFRVVAPGGPDRTFILSREQLAACLPHVRVRSLQPVWTEIELQALAARKRAQTYVVGRVDDALGCRSTRMHDGE